MNGAPLSYVVRKQLVPTAEADNPLNGYDIIDDEIIERTTIVVAVIVGTTSALEANRPFTASYLTGWATVWAKLNAIVAEHTARLVRGSAMSGRDTWPCVCYFNGLSGHYPLLSHVTSAPSVTSRPRLHDTHSPHAIPENVHGARLSRVIH